MQWQALNIEWLHSSSKWFPKTEEKKHERKGTFVSWRENEWREDQIQRVGFRKHCLTFSISVWICHFLYSKFPIREIIKKTDVKYKSWQKLTFLIRQAIRIVERPSKISSARSSRTENSYVAWHLWNLNLILKRKYPVLPEFKYQFAVLKMRPQHESSTSETKTSQYPNAPNRFFVRRNGQHALSPLLCPKGTIVFFYWSTAAHLNAEGKRGERRE